jgi:hypothetical protein
MLEACPGAFIYWQRRYQRAFPQPGYDFNDVALPIGASLFARLVEESDNSQTFPTATLDAGRHGVYCVDRDMRH